MNVLLEVFTDYTLRNVALGSALLGVVGGVVGAFAVLRRQSLLGDALSHAALPGICLAFLLAGAKVPLLLLIGGGVAGWLAALAMLAVLKYTRLPEDSALGVMLSAFFGFGVALLTFIQNGDNANQAGLDKFLFGQAATIVAADVATMALIGGLALVIVTLLYKEFKLVSFDPDYASTLGFPAGRLGALLTSLAALAVMVGLQTVGVVLMSAMLVAPAAAARQWTDRLGAMLALSALFGAASGLTGALISASAPQLPTGPFAIVAVSLILILSLLFAPLRGLVWDQLRSRGQRRTLQLDRALLDAHVLYNHAELSVAALAARQHTSEATAASRLRDLEARGLARPAEARWTLTESGLAQARILTGPGRGGPERDLERALIAAARLEEGQGVRLTALRHETGLPAGQVEALARELVGLGWAEPCPAGWELTEQGHAAAHRLEAQLRRAALTPARTGGAL